MGAIIRKEKAWDDDWKTWWSRWHGFHHSRHDDGRILVTESKDWDAQDGDAAIIERIITKGVPLPTVRSAEDLKSFIEPLLREVDTYREGA